MYLTSFQDSDIDGAALAMPLCRRDNGTAAQAEPAELVEWEMSAGQVGALVAAMCVVFSLVWMIG